MSLQSSQAAMAGDSVPPGRSQLLAAQSVGHLDCPIGPWIYAQPAYRVPALTGPFMHLVLTSWLQAPSGSLPDDAAALTAWSGLSTEAFVASRAILFSGWTRSLDRLWFPPLVERADSLLLHQGDVVELMRQNAGALCLDPERFALAGTTEDRANAKTRRVKRPKSFAIDSRIFAWGTAFFNQQLVSQGARRQADRDEVLATLNQIFQQFVVYTDAHGTRYDDWYAGFQQFVHRQTNGSFGMTLSTYFPALFDQPRGVPLQPAQIVPRPVLGSRRDRVVAGANDALAGAIAMIGGTTTTAAEDDPMVFDLDEVVCPRA